MTNRYYCTVKRCQKEIDYYLRVFGNLDSLICAVKATIFDLSETPEFEKSNPNQLRFWRKVLTMIEVK